MYTCDFKTFFSLLTSCVKPSLFIEEAEVEAETIVAAPPPEKLEIKGKGAERGTTTARSPSAASSFLSVCLV